MLTEEQVAMHVCDKGSGNEAILRWLKTPNMRTVKAHIHKIRTKNTQTRSDTLRLEKLRTYLIHLRQALFNNDPERTLSYKQE